MNSKEKLRHIEEMVKSETQKVTKELKIAEQKKSPQARRTVYYSAGELYILKIISRMLKPER